MYSTIERGVNKICSCTSKTCPSRKSYPRVAMMQFGQDWCEARPGQCLLWVMNGPDALEMRCPLLSRKQTSIGRRRKVGFLDLIPKSLRTNQAHRSRADKLQRFDRPPFSLSGGTCPPILCDHLVRGSGAMVEIDVVPRRSCDCLRDRV